MILSKDVKEWLSILRVYPGEGHGWRKEESMRDAFEWELPFYERILKLKQEQ